MSKNSVAQPKSTQLSSTLRYLPVAEIHDDTVILKDGSARAILEIENINFGLKSEAEQNSIIYAYQSFLNSLEFPLQIMLTSRKLDIDGYLGGLKDRAKNQSNQLIQEQTVDYISFVERFIEFADIMEKKSYIVIPVDRLGTSGVEKNIFQQFWEHIHPDDSMSQFRLRLKEFERLKKKLQQRVNIVKSGIEGCSITARQLETAELIELFYEQYNPLTSYTQKLKDWEAEKGLGVKTHLEEQSVDALKK